jgi:hypothetical protein
MNTLSLPTPTDFCNNEFKQWLSLLPCDGKYYPCDKKYYTCSDGTVIRPKRYKRVKLNVYMVEQRIGLFFKICDEYYWAGHWDFYNNDNDDRFPWSNGEKLKSSIQMFYRLKIKF